jgi:putative addiction module CopG family antidote
VEIHLPEDLQQFLRDQVASGRFASEDEVVREALVRFQQTQQSVLHPPLTTDPLLGSMRDDAELLNQIVEEAMRSRKSQPLRLSPSE